MYKMRRKIWQNLAKFKGNCQKYFEEIWKSFEKNEEKFWEVLSDRKIQITGIQQWRGKIKILRLLCDDTEEDFVKLH